MAYDDVSMIDKSSSRGLIIGIAALIILIGAGVIYYFSTRTAELPRAAALPSAAVPTEPAVAHPVPEDEGAAPQATLPSLADSDAPLRDALKQAAGSPSAAQYLVPDSLVRHLVVTVDNLPRQRVALDKRPVQPVAGSFAVDGDELHASLDAKNYARYKPIVEAMRELDMKQVAGVYFHFYPLFQHAYQDLGYPNGYFNDRLVQVIDVLLATPPPRGAIELVRPNVMYTFADPALEALPAGQKILLRMGAENAAIVKVKLRELRAIISATPPKRG